MSFYFYFEIEGSNSSEGAGKNTHTKRRVLLDFKSFSLVAKLVWWINLFVRSN